VAGVELDGFQVARRPVEIRLGEEHRVVREEQPDDPEQSQPNDGEDPGGSDVGAQDHGSPHDTRVGRRTWLTGS
jgi:hypothetical protein